MKIINDDVEVTEAILKSVTEHCCTGIEGLMHTQNLWGIMIAFIGMYHHSRKREIALDKISQGEIIEIDDRTIGK